MLAVAFAQRVDADERPALIHIVPVVPAVGRIDAAQVGGRAVNRPVEVANGQMRVGADGGAVGPVGGIQRLSRREVARFDETAEG